MSNDQRGVINKIFFFDSMITPKIITLVYWFILVCVAIGAAGIALSSNFLLGIIVLVGGAVSARIWCELMIVLFKINENIQRIVNRSNGHETDPFA